MAQIQVLTLLVGYTRVRRYFCCCLEPWFGEKMRILITTNMKYIYCTINVVLIRKFSIFPSYQSHSLVTWPTRVRLISFNLNSGHILSAKKNRFEAVSNITRFCWNFDTNSTHTVAPHFCWYYWNMYHANENCHKMTRTTLFDDDVPEVGFDVIFFLGNTHTHSMRCGHACIYENYHKSNTSLHRI